MNPLKLSWKNQVNKPLSMMLSLILFALGVGLISILLMLNKQVQEKFTKNLAGIDLVVGAKGSPLQMILCNMYHIDAPTGNIAIKSARPFMNPRHPLIKLAVPLSLGDSYKAYRIVGTTYEYVDSIFGGQLAEGKLWEADFEVTIGATVASRLNLNLGDRFHSSHGLVDDDINVHDHGDGFKVVGILKAHGSVLDQLILTSPESIWAVHDHGPEAPAPTAEKSTETTEAHDHSDHDHDHDHEGHSHEEHDHEGHNHEGHDHEGHNHEGHDHSKKTTPKIPLTEQVDKDITSLLVRYRNKSNWRALNLPRNINENTDMQSAIPAIEINRLYSMMGVGMDALEWLARIIVFVSGLSIFISLFSSTNWLCLE